MYRGFNIELNWSKDTSFKYFETIGENLFQSNLQQTKVSLDQFIQTGGKLDGSAIQDFWFPQIEADIFISHSHKDIDTAKALSGWLSEKFGLKTFIDACIWRHSNELLAKIDHQYCLLPEVYPIDWTAKP